MDNLFPITIKSEDIKVNMGSLKSGDLTRKAIATLQCGPFKISGFRVQEGKYQNEKGNNLWVQPPSYRGKNGKFHDTFWVENKDLWKHIENMILEKYQELLTESEIKMEDIPIIQDSSR